MATTSIPGWHGCNTSHHWWWGVTVVLIIVVRTLVVTILVVNMKQVRERKEITMDKTRCYKIEVNMYLQTNFLQNITPEIGCEIYVFKKLFFFKNNVVKNSILRPLFIPLNLILGLS